VASRGRGPLTAAGELGEIGERVKYTHPYLTICLLDGCNKVCKHCYRTAVPSDHGFKLDVREVALGLDDAASLGTACLFAGGEPTIWQDDGVDFLGLLKQAAKRNGRVAFLSNGFVFEDQVYAKEFMRRYAQECGLPIRMMFSVDFLHENYDAEDGSIPFLDNLLVGRDMYADDVNVEFFVLSHWTNDESLNIPVEVFERYAERGVTYGIDDYMTWGRGAKIDDLSCYVQVGSSDKTPLGPYKQVLLQKMRTSGKVQDADDFERLSNRELLTRASVCGRAPNYFISWGTKYYYCIPHMGYDWFSISESGKLDPASVEAFFAEHPVIQEIQTSSVLGLVERYKHVVGETLLEEIETMQESIRFAGCSVCLKLFKAGVLQEINQSLIDESGAD
jgi:molybdenum cofactor biosynthesis enzyme MoaA